MKVAKAKKQTEQPQLPPGWVLEHQQPAPGQDRYFARQEVGAVRTLSFSTEAEAITAALELEKSNGQGLTGMARKTLAAISREAVPKLAKKA